MSARWAYGSLAVAYTHVGYKHATLTGRTPTATAHATLLNLVRKGALVKPERGTVKLAGKGRS